MTAVGADGEKGMNMILHDLPAAEIAAGFSLPTASELTGPYELLRLQLEISHLR